MTTNDLSAVFEASMAQVAAATFSIYLNNEEARVAVQNVINSIEGRCPTNQRIEQGGRDHVEECFSSESNLHSALCCFPYVLRAFVTEQDNVTVVKDLAERLADTIDYTDY